MPEYWVMGRMRWICCCLESLTYYVTRLREIVRKHTGKVALSPIVTEASFGYHALSAPFQGLEHSVGMVCCTQTRVPEDAVEGQKEVI